MNVDNIITYFCNCRGCKVEDIYDNVTTDLASHTRYMIYGYLHGKCGWRTYELAAKFNRTKRSVQRGMVAFRAFLKHHADIRDEYNSIVQKMEATLNECDSQIAME